MSVRALAVSMFLAIGLAAQSAAARDLASLGPDEIRSLQQRLRDAGCYKGAVDGAATPALVEAVKVCPNQEPVLRIETNMHTAVMYRLGIDRECKTLVTGSEDKTVRTWSLPEGKLIRTFRPPLGDGDFGKIYATAITPDGKRIAVGGWDAYYKQNENGAYLFDSATDGALRRYSVSDQVIHHLAFTSDGSKLAASLDGKNGVRIIDAKTGKVLLADRDYAERSRGLAFGPDDTLYAVAYDGYLRHYSRNFKRTHKVKTPGGQRPHSVAVDPTGKRVAVGYDDARTVEIFDARTLERVAVADNSDIASGNLLAVSWTSDGKYVLGGGRYQRFVDGEWQYPVRIWDANGRQVNEVMVADNTVLHMMPCGDSVYYVAHGPVYGRIDPLDGTVTKIGLPPIPDMRGKRDSSFMISPDGTRLRFGLETFASEPVVFDLAAGTLQDAPEQLPDLMPANVSALKIADWLHNTKPTLNDKPLQLATLEEARSLAIRPDASGFLLGADWSLRSFEADGKQRWRMDVPGTAWGINLARDGELAAVAYADGTIRWHRWSDGRVLLTLFIYKEDKRWVAWTPTGYYMASPGGEGLIGWHINRGWEQSADFFPASRFRERFNRPDIVRLVLQTLDEDEAVKSANETAKRKQETKPLLSALPPVLRITSPVEGTRFSGDEVTLGYELRSPSGTKVDRIEVFIDGRLQQERGAIAAPSDEVKVKLPRQDVEVSLIAWSGDVASEPSRIKLTWGGRQLTGEQLLKPKLYALVVGVSKHNERAWELRYAAKDATDFAKALEAQRGLMYGDVTVRLLRDQEVTRDSIAEGLEWLEKEVTSRDVGVVFLAGHGWTDEKNAYWFLPANATPERVRVRGVPQDDIRRTLRNLAGKAVLFLDTCHAGQAMADTALRRGNVDIDGVINDFVTAENGVVVFASSKGKEVSLERDDWQNGAFTKAVIEGLHEGKANLLDTGKITASMLDVFVAERVKQLTGGRQHPVMTKPDTVPDFPIAVVRK
ncbi:MAG: caspase family protein [Xanthobacteraceae bacterium]